MTEKEPPFFAVEEISISYGPVTAVKSLSFQLQRGEIVTLIGANGAGKSTTLKAISGLKPPDKGKIRFEGEDITRLAPHKIVGKKICQVPEGRGVFLNLTVTENLDLGSYIHPDKSSFSTDLARVFELFPRLKERRKQSAGTLSGGEQQMLAIGRALMAHPRLLLLDEPSLGLAPQIIEKIFEIILEINRQGVSILLVEQNALQALQIAHHGLVLETGNLVIYGKAKDLLASDQVRAAYLGG